MQLSSVFVVGLQGPPGTDQDGEPETPKGKYIPLQPFCTAEGGMNRVKEGLYPFAE